MGTGYQYLGLSQNFAQNAIPKFSPIVLLEKLFIKPVNAHYKVAMLLQHIDLRSSVLYHSLQTLRLPLTALLESINRFSRNKIKLHTLK